MAVTVRLADCAEVPRLVVIVARVLVDTADVSIVNVAEVEPLATVTVDGTTALPELLERLMIAPARGAGFRSVTVPVVGLPPTTEAGVRLTDVMALARTVKVLETPPPRALAAMRVEVSAETLFVVSKIPAVVAPAGTVRTPVKSAIVGFVDDSVTEKPLAGAAPVR